MIVKLLTEHHLEFSAAQARLSLYLLNVKYISLINSLHAG